MSCLGRAAAPAKRVWLGLKARLCRRATTGLRKLRKDVRTCEYHDVHVMWEMLQKTDAPTTLAAAQKGGAGRRKAAWRRLFSYCCAF